MNKTIVAGVDIGGSHITASLIDIESRRMLPSAIFRKEVDSSASSEDIIRNWCHTIESCFTAENLSYKKIGIAMPGPVDYETGVCYIKDQNKYESLYKSNLKELIAAGLNIETKDILMINDAAGFLSGEVFNGPGRGFNRVVGLTLGTGLGSSFYENGIVTDEDLWHSSFKDGKAEDYISAPWLLAAARRVTGFTFLDVKQMAIQADNDKRLAEIFNEFGKNLGLFLVNYARTKEPSMIILGGNVAKAHRLFKPTIERILSEARVTATLEVAEMGEKAALFGAAALWRGKLPYGMRVGDVIDKG